MFIDEKQMSTHYLLAGVTRAREVQCCSRFANVMVCTSQGIVVRSKCNSCRRESTCYLAQGGTDAKEEWSNYCLREWLKRSKTF